MHSRPMTAAILLWLGNVDMKRPRRVIIEVLARHAALQIEEP